MRLGDLALDSMCSQQGLDIQGQESVSVPESLTFGDETLFSSPISLVTFF